MRHSRNDIRIRGRNILSGASISQFAFDFANNIYSTPSGSSSDPVADGLLAVARANGTSYAENADGTWSSFAANTLRRTTKGIAVERAATTYINNQNHGAAASGAISDVLIANKGTLPNQWSVANFPTGLFYQVLDIGTDSATGFPRTRLRVSGTAAADNTPSIRFSASGSATTGSPPITAGQYIVSSMFLSHFAGTPAPNLFMDTSVFNAATPANRLVATDAFISGLTGADTSTRARVYFPEPTSTPSSVARYETYPVLCYATCDNHRMYLQFDVKNGVFYDFTIDIIMPQCEVVPGLEYRATTPIYSPSLATTWTAAVTAATSNTVASATGLQIGMVVAGTGVSYATTITNIVGTTLTFSKAITVSNGAAVRFIGGTREQDVIQAAGAALTKAQGATATIKATVAALGYRQSFRANTTKGVSTAAERARPIVGLNGSTALLNHESDGSVSTAYGSGARTFKTFLGNHSIKSNEHIVSWNGSNLALSSQAGGDYMTKASGATSITSVQFGTKGDTTALDGYISKIVISDAYTVDTTVGNVAADVIVYGAKPGGIMAAYRAKAEGRTVAIIGDWREHVVGGVMSGGLGFTDFQGANKTIANVGSKASGTTVFTVADATGIVVGCPVSRTGAIASGTYVTNVSGSDVTISAASTATVADAALITFGIVNRGSEQVILRASLASAHAIGANTLTVNEDISSWMVGGPIIQSGGTDTSIPWGTTITAINTGTKTITISNRLRAALSSGAVVRTTSEGGYGGLPRWVFSRACTKALVQDEAFYAEPRIFRSVFEDMLCEEGIAVYYSGGVDAVTKSGTNITQFTTASRTVGSAICSPKTATPVVVVGADYEGDFLPKAGISVSKLREARAAYGEQQNGYSSSGVAGGGGGQNPTIPDSGTPFNVDPWVTPGTPASGVIQGMTPIQVLATTGSGSGTNVGDFAYVTADNKVYRWTGSAWALPTAGDEDDTALQAYNFRLTMTNDTTRMRNIFSGTTGSLVTNAATTASTVLNFADTSNLAVGYGVFHANIPYGTTITSKTSTTATINATVTVASGQTITYLNPADFGFTAARAELHIRTIKAYDDAATGEGRTYTTNGTAQTAGQWGFLDFIQLKTATGLGTVSDANNQGGIGLDYISGNKGYLGLSYADRETMWRDHINHCLCQFWVFQFYVDARIRAALQTNARLWNFDMWHYNDALSSEPFQFNSQLYVREGRRMKNADYTGGAAAYNEVDVCGTDGVAPRDPKSVAVIAYPLDSHQMHRLPVYNTGPYTYHNEGGLGLFAGSSNGPLGTVFGSNLRGPIGIDAMTPAASECTNYVTSFHGAISHSAFGGFRMEPTSMALGEGAGLLAAMAVEGAVGVRSVTYGDTSTSGTFRYRLLNTATNPTGSPTKPVAPLVN